MKNDTGFDGFYKFWVYIVIFLATTPAFSQKKTIHSLLYNSHENCHHMEQEQIVQNTDPEYTHDVAFVLKGFDNSCEACDVSDFQMHAKKITEYLANLSFGKIKTFKIFNGGVDSRSPDFMQSLRDIEVLQASLDGWTGPQWAWLANRTDYWKVVPAEYRPIITNAINWIKNNKLSFAQWGVKTEEGKQHYFIIQNNVQRMGSSASLDYLKDMRMPEGFERRNYRITLIIFNTSGKAVIAGGGLQSSFDNFGLLDFNGVPYKWNIDGIGNNVAYTAASLNSASLYTITIHEAIHAFGMGTHDQDPNDLAVDYSIMYRSNISSFNTLPAWNRYFWCNWLPASTITTNVNEVADIKDRPNLNDANLKYILEVVKGDEKGRGGTYREKYDGKWYTYKLDAGGTLTFIDKLDKIHYKPTNYIDAIPEIITEGKKAVFRIYSDGDLDHTYQWFKNGVAISNANKDSLVFSSVKLSDAGSYSVKISNFHGNNITNPVRVKVLCAAGPQPIPEQYISVCQNATLPPAIAKADQGNNLIWYTSDSATIGSTSTPFLTTQNPGLFNYFVSQKNNSGCESVKTPITINVKPTPQSPTAGNVEFCQNSAFPTIFLKFEESNSQRWYLSDTSTSGNESTPNFFTQTPGIYRYYVSQVNTKGCESPRTTFSITLKPTPSRLTIDDQTFCQNSKSPSITVLVDNGNQSIWYTSSTATSGSNIPPEISTSVPGTFQFFVSQRNPLGCQSERSSVNIIIRPLPLAPIVQNKEYCQNTTPTALTASFDIGNQLLWYSSSTSTSGSTIAPSISTTVLGTIQFFVSQRNSLGCESQRSVATVTINANPSAPFTENKEFCQNSTPAILSALSDAGNQLWWYPSLSSTAGNTQPPSLSTTVPGTIQFFVSQRNPLGCESQRATLNVNVQMSPAPPVTENIEICQFAKTTPINVKFDNNNELRWYTSLNATSGSTIQPPISTQQYGLPLSFYVSQKSKLGCESSKAAVNINIKYTPVAPFVHFIKELCQNDEVPLRVDHNPTSKILWYIDTTKVGSTQIPVISPDQPGVYRYFVTETPNTGCESAKTEVNINIKPSPPIPTLSIVNNSEIQSSAEKNSWYWNNVLLSDTTKTIKPKISGIYTAEAVTDKCKSKKSQPLNFILSALEEDLINKFSVKPNPFEDFITLEFSINEDKVSRVEMITLTGEMIMSKTPVESGTNFNVSDLPNGIFFLKIYFNANGTVISKKLIKI